MEEVDTHTRRTLTMQGQENGVGFFVDCLVQFVYFVAYFDNVNIQGDYKHIFQPF